MKRTAIASFLSAVLALAATSAVGLTSAGAAPGHHSKSKSSTVKFTKSGQPTLKGMTIAVGNAAGSAHIGDTNVHDLVGFLKKWGANATQTNASHNAVELAVESGSLDVAVGPLPTEVDAGLVTFGPNQARLTDELLGKSTIKSLKDLKGKTIAYCCTASPDGVLLNAVLKKAHLSKSQVHLLATGASTASLNALIAGQVTAAFTAAGGLPTAANSFKPLTNATKLVPEYADSFMAATPAWLKSHKAEAVAVDLAWLASAKVFNGSESQWVKNAATYTSNADTTAQYQTAWKQLKVLAGWPVTAKTYTATAVKFNLAIAKTQTGLQGAGLRPAAKETTVSSWNTAWSLFKHHEKSL